MSMSVGPDLDGSVHDEVVEEKPLDQWEPVQRPRTLWDIEQGLLAIAFKIEECEEAGVEPTPEVLAELNLWVLREKDKADAIGCLLSELQAEAGAIQEQARKLAARAARRENTRRRIMNHVLLVMQGSGLMRLEGRLATLRRQKNPASVAIDDESLIPASCKTTPEPVVSKTLIKAAIEKGESVPGARLVTDGEHLRVVF